MRRSQAASTNRSLAAFGKLQHIPFGFFLRSRIPETGLETEPTRSDGRSGSDALTTIGVSPLRRRLASALRSIVRCETGEDYTTFLTRLAEASGIATPTRAELARFDRSRTKKTSNAEWTQPHDPDARVTKMTDGRMHLAHKAEHTVDLETGAVVGVTVQGADTGDTASMVETLIAAAEQVDAVLPDGPGIEDVVGEKGYHSNETMADLKALGLRSYISELAPGGAPVLEAAAGGSRRRVGRPAPSAPAVSRGVAGAAVRARVRDGRDATGPERRLNVMFSRVVATSVIPLEGGVAHRSGRIWTP